MDSNTSTSWKSRFPILLVAVSVFSILTLWEFPIAKSITHNQGKVFVVYAGSLIKIFEDVIGPAFHKETGYTFVGEGKGSVHAANMIKDGFRNPDVFVSAGANPILKLMDNKPSLAEWLLEFGSAEIVISYSTNSPYYDYFEKSRKGEIPWHEVLSKQGLKFGRTDPELDPKGYYAIMTANLANFYYNDTSIKERILGEDRNPKQIFPEEILKTILESGQLDAVVSYKHEAVSRGLPYITLPKEINLGDPSLSAFYKKANYTSESGQNTIYGEPIYFSITIPKKAKNIDSAISFVEFILSENGSQILENQGIRSVDLMYDGNMEKMPPHIRKVISP
ncbi:MAG TPA: extracellular solute-binding protein [Phototrophicaceae bacterium]|nr:extracellular solute-binding protein [Phototrophicaceae bacterium]